MSAPETTGASNNSMDPQYKWYILSLATWFGSFGLQSILFPYIVLYEMQASPFEAGIAQMCLMLPSLFFIPLGGLVADHVELRGYLVRMHTLALLPPLVMAGLYMAEVLTYPMTIAFALTMGVLTAFCIPARDAMLHSVVGNNMQKGVAGAMGTQFGSQIIGIAIASLTSTVGVPILLMIQSLLVGTGAPMLKSIKPVPPHPKEEASHVLRDLADGFKEVWSSKPILPFCVLTVGVGIFFIGVFMVGIPVFVRDIYPNNEIDLTIFKIALSPSHSLSIAMGAFSLGTIVTSIVLMRRGGIRRVGRAFILALCGGVAIELILTQHISYWAFVFLIFLWGCGAGVTMTMGRSFVQETARPSHRARILAIYSLGFMGGGPLGSLLIGYLIEQIGVYTATFYAAVGMGILLLITALTSNILTAVRPDTSEPA